MGQFSGSLKPDYVIPFQVDKKAAKAALKQHYGGKRLLPKVFKDQNHIDEIKGIYVPVWLFNADADANIRYKDIVRVALRTAKDVDATDEEWQEFIAHLEERRRKIQEGK